MEQHILFSNSPLGLRDFTINFFYENARGLRSAQLACPFFSSAEPLEILTNEGCSKIQLIVRLCSFTSPSALMQAKLIPKTQIRYFTSDAFHAKFYVLGNVALIGSANLTNSGL